jgi:mono/diheme cytochrome c family protein
MTLHTKTAIAALSAALLPLAAFAQTTSPAAAADKVARGKYIVSTAGCHDCHTPWKMGPKGPEPDMTRALSGHPQDFKLPPAPAPQGPWIMTAAATNTAWAGPWGVSFTANLTPDRETGLGKWTQRNFTETIRTGRHMGRGREVLPPMPIQVYRNLTDEDLEAVFSYLQSIPAISNRVPEPLHRRRRWRQSDARESMHARWTDAHRASVQPPRGA